jgi:hypothetical protein
MIEPLHNQGIAIPRRGFYLMSWIIGMFTVLSGVAGLIYVLDYFGVVSMKSANEAKINDEVVKRRPSGALVIVMLIITWAVVGYDFIDRHKSFTFISEPGTIVVGKTFEREVVPLDGFNYEHCIFNQVTFLLNSTRPIQFSNNEIIEPITFKTDNLAIANAIATFAGLCMISPILQLNKIPNLQVPPECEQLVRKWVATH